MIKNTAIAIALVLLGVGSYFYFIIYPMLPLVNGYAAKKMCSCTFIAGRSQESIQNYDLSFSPVDKTSTIIDRENKSVTTSIFGMASRTAVFRDDIGCILINGTDNFNTNLSIPEPVIVDSLTWPYGNESAGKKIKGVNYELLNNAIANAFDPSLEMVEAKTRAVVVLYQDTLIGEQYANGYSKDTPLLGWSMTKGIMNALIGIMSKDNILNVKDDHLFDLWDDERSKITLDDLMQMQSGLAFEEEYAKLSDATRMLYMTDNIVQLAIDNPLAYPIGSHWSYSTGTSNIISGLIRSKFSTLEDYLRFPHEALFNKIGMSSAVMETDESGNYIGSSYCYATPRDWAKFGTLYLNKGVWNGERILSDEWVEYTQEVAEYSGGIYGAHFWHNKGHSAYPDVPEDSYSCNGFQGQYVFIIPSYNLVVVRMGLSEQFDINKFLKGILEAIDSVS